MKTAVPMPKGVTPRQWQEDAMAAIYEGVKLYSKILVSAATGVGKGSLIAALAVRESYNGKRLLFLVHRDELLDDIMGRVKAVRPGLNIGKVKGKMDQLHNQIVFASVQSLRGSRLGHLEHFDFVITDEAHHATAPSYLDIYRQIEKVNPYWKHIGFTATPFRYGGSGKTSGLGAAFERLVYEYPLHKAISDGALCQIRGVAVETQLDIGAIDTSNTDLLSKIVDTDSRNKIVAEKYIKLANNKQAIFFAVTIAHAARLAQELTRLGVVAESVWGFDPNRAEKIARYKSGETKVLCNCELLTEGFDAPQTEAVVLVRPTGSIGLYSQMVGRVTRLYPGKAEGLVIDFVGNATKYPLVQLSDLTTPMAATPMDLRLTRSYEALSTEQPPLAIGATHTSVDLFGRPGSSFYGYAKAKNSHELAPFTSLLRAAGCDLLRIDVTGETTELDGLIDFMSRGDVLIVCHVGHLGETIEQVNSVLQKLVLNGLELRLAESKQVEKKPETIKTPKTPQLSPSERAEVQRVGIERAKKEGLYRGRKKKVNDEDVARLISDGMNKADIARKLGISRETVYQCIKRAPQ
jgi:superfamily II DNA or RNA helicase